MGYMKLSLEEADKWLKENLSEKRYQHSLGTAECAKELAKHFGQNEEKAYIAGLLHDCAKCFSDEKLLEIIDKYLDDVDSDERSNRKTLHAPGSYYTAKTVFLGYGYAVSRSPVISYQGKRHLERNFLLPQFDKFLGAL